MPKTKKTISSVLNVAALAVLASACGPNQRILESANDNTAAAESVVLNSNGTPAATTFEQDLNAMRTADFKFIVAFRRKDRQAFGAADKELFSKVAAQANRRRLSDEGKAIIIGSNFPFPAGEFRVLEERFTMENYSKADSGDMFVSY